MGDGKVPRWRCGVCKRRAVQRHGEGHDGRPRYQCGFCGDWHTSGWFGKDDDPVPSKHPGVKSRQS